MKRLKNFTLLFILGLLVASCDNDDSLNPVTDPVLDNIRYDLDERSESGVSGDAVFNEQADGSVQLILEVEGTSAGNMHPAHIHMNSAVEGGSIIVSLEPVDGETGLSITTFTSLDDGTPISFEDISELDAYINVHLSANDLGTIVAQGDIGQNELTGESKSYDLEERAVPGIAGSVLFEERMSGEALATISLGGTPDGGMHPAHIHMNSAVEGGGILYTFNPVNGTTGMSQSNVATLDDGSEFVYADILEVDGYVNVHLSADDLGTIVAQGDIGQNELTGESKSYELEERAVPGISGSVLFEERMSGEALATISLEGTPDGGEHPAHIHMNTAVEGGAILYTFNPVNGTTGMSQSNVATLDDGTAFVYADVLEVDGYVNVHLSADDLGTIVAQGDIGQNELTGESKNYELEERAVPGISGSVLFEERLNGEALATISLEGTPDGGEHPAHIHMNTAVEGGGILYTFNPVNGTTGMSQSNVAALDDETEFGYADVLGVDGYVNVHLSADDLGTIVAQGDIGQNELTGESKSYVLEEKDVTGINGTVLFEERLNGEALATISLVGTPDGGEHPAHIHANSASEGGGIIYTFIPVDGTTGMSMSNVAALDDNTEFGYADVLEVNGYVNVHLSAAELATIVAQGDIGANE
ncbi:CHRD domain-containing protein [Psychroflexus sp. CAK8W]|uniref:CHRD domain-containing protein n=1 Tax=Psychroflexus longus TaxID=2873596 RepID=A0ABS7XKQ7_9FLAO|nr:CHRD domain-containing protein [Psychroflexus longus]MBZ9779579.1 CHRD domain-containing protein [Psychroflexus longus]